MTIEAHQRTKGSALRHAGRASWLGLAGALALPGLLVILLGLAGCDDGDDCVCCGADREAPAAPRGLYSITGDGEVIVVWLANTESDLDGYRVYRSDEYDGTYYLLTSASACGDCYWVELVDDEVQNGETNFYAVTAIDHAGNESDLSGEYVWDTPRPDGDAEITNALDPDGYEEAGFDLHTARAVAADDSRADFFYTHDEAGGGFLFAGNEHSGVRDLTEIQDLGYTADFDEISFAPENLEDPGDVGWSPTGSAEPIRNHTYVLLTSDDHYAKIRVTEVTPRRVEFEWAFQLVPGNRQLKHPVTP
jgi:hypothetical protein